MSSPEVDAGGVTSEEARDNGYLTGETGENADVIDNRNIETVKAIAANAVIAVNTDENETNKNKNEGEGREGEEEELKILQASQLKVNQLEREFTAENISAEVKMGNQISVESEENISTDVPEVGENKANKNIIEMPVEDGHLTESMDASVETASEEDVNTDAEMFTDDRTNSQASCSAVKTPMNRRASWTPNRRLTRTRSGMSAKSLHKVVFSPSQPNRRIAALDVASSPLPGAGKKALSNEKTKKRKLSGASPIQQSSKKKQTVNNVGDLFQNIQTMLNEAETRQTKTLSNTLSTAMATLEKKQEEYMKEIKDANKKALASIKKEQKDFIKDQSKTTEELKEDSKKAMTIAQSAQDATKKAEKELKQLNNKIQSLKSEIEHGVDMKQKFVEVQLTDMKELQRKAGEHGKKCRAALHERLNDVEEKSKELEGLLNSISTSLKPEYFDDFPVDRTIVARFVRQPENVEVEEIAQAIIHDALELTTVNIVKVQSMSRDENHLGTLKILLESKKDLSEVLRHKNKLNDYDSDPEIQNIQIRKSKTQEQFVFEQNTDEILKAINEYGSYYRDARGFLVKKGGQGERSRGETHAQNSDPRRGGSSGRTRGRGGPRGSRGRGRGQNRSHNQSQTRVQRPRRELSTRSRQLFSQGGEGDRHQHWDQDSEQDNEVEQRTGNDWNTVGSNNRNKRGRKH